MTHSASFGGVVAALALALSLGGCDPDGDAPVDAGALDTGPVDLDDCIESEVDPPHGTPDCEGVDIHDPAACTPARTGLACRGRAMCAEGVEDPGDVVRCCDGRVWETTYTDPEACGLPEGDQGVDQGLDMEVDGGVGGAARCEAARDAIDPFEYVDGEACRPVSIHVAGDCTGERAGLVCRGFAMCEPPFDDPGSIFRCCDGERWVTVAEDPDPCGLPTPDPEPDAGVDTPDGGPFSGSCDAMGAEPREHLSSPEICRALDTTDPDDCTAANQYVVCAQSAQCDNDFFDPGSVIRCCDGERWVFVDSDPDLCGGAPDAGP